jgi:DNA-directed RNA polymerase specialized sigma24 family protein
LALPDVARRCAQETSRFFGRQQHDPAFCYELFRRALADRDECAWELLYTQYSPLVTGWVKRHPAFAASGEDPAYFVNRTFEKLWVALTSERFGCFPDLPALLRYLQMCVHSAVVDHLRGGERAAIGAADDPPPEESGEDEAGADLERAEFWQAVGSRLHDEKERRVVYGSFVLGLKPREMQSRFPGTFRDVQEVYAIKENVLARLGRDAELRKLLMLDA